LSLSSDEDVIIKASPSVEDNVVSLSQTVSSMFQNTETYLCSDIKYFIANKDKGELLNSLESQVRIVNDRIEINQKNYDN
jgi:hypothetical protein